MFAGYTFEENLKWIDEGIAKLMYELEHGIVPDYPEELLQLAELILKNRVDTAEQSALLCTHDAANAKPSCIASSKKE